LDAMLSMRSMLRLCSKDGRESVGWRLPEPWDSKIWAWVLWDSEPRITVLAKASSSLAVSCESWVLSRQSEVGVGGYQTCIVRRRYQATTIKDIADWEDCVCSSDM
jgi:hypothetical protein